MPPTPPDPNPVACPSDVVIKSPSDWATLVESGCTSISGTLTLFAVEVTSFGPPATALTSVGQLSIVKNPGLTRLSLPALTEADGIGVEANEALETLDLPMLANVGKVTITGDAYNFGRPTTLSLPKLGTAREGFVLYKTRFAALDLPVLTGSGGELQIFDLTLTRVSLPALTSVVGGRVAIGGENLATIRLPSLKTGGHYLTVSGPALTHLELTALETTGGLYVLQTSVLELSFPSLADVGALVLTGNSQLMRLSAPLLRSGGLEITGNPALRQCLVDDLKRQLMSGDFLFGVRQRRHA
jgi:hypothetical protein